jgi:hypothetical protein
VGVWANATKWPNRTAQGFYEADFVKATLQKVFLKSFASFGPRSSDKRPMTGSLVLDRHGARDEHRDDQAPKVSEAIWRSATGTLLAEGGFSGWEDPPFWG